MKGKHYDIEPHRPGLRFQENKAIVTLWAPYASRCELLILDTGERQEMNAAERGYWYLESLKIKAGYRYRFILDDHTGLPDPASLAQPEGVHGPSQAIRLDGYTWTDRNWINPPLSQYLIYELHTGAFSDTEDFAGITKHFEHLKELGINAIELMPVAQFPGTRNWGYDGVFPYCVQHAYGGAAALQAFVDQCHHHGFAVVLDVVYNHIGPEGNVLQQFGPYFTEKYKTPWGMAVNFDDAGSNAVRHYFVQNALMWLRDFHIDALRMDAVHAITDFSPVSIVQEIAAAISILNTDSASKRYLILETDLNDSRYIKPVVQGGYGADAQWCDDFHHALRVAAGQEKTGYYKDFEGLHDLARSFENAYVYTGQYSEERQRNHGTPTGDLSGDHFIIYSQNHDQVGNRMLGERSSQLYSFGMQKLLATVTLTAPFIPMLFMGEEWGAGSPFLYFTDHSDPVLIRAVEEGRRREFAGFRQEGEPPPANDPATFRRSKLQWRELQQQPNAALYQYYKQLIRLRKENPALHNFDAGSVRAWPDKKEAVLVVERSYKEQTIICLFNFSNQQHDIFFAPDTLPFYVLLAPADKRPEGKNDTILFNNQDGRLVLPPESAILLANYHV